MSLPQHISQQLTHYGQAHLLQFEAQLDSAGRQRLVQQLEQIDWPQLQRLTSHRDQAIDWSELSARAEPPPAVRLDRPHPQFGSAEARAAGETALRAGRVGLILVAGGQGTRLGFEHPKGMFPVGPISGRTLFQMHCDRLLALMQRYRTSIPLLVMTSPATDDETRAYFDAQQRCGLAPEDLIIFCQGTMPAVDAQSGKVLLAAPDQLALSPDGHGGLLAALERHGCLAQAKSRGIDLFTYAQVDNPLAELCDPELIGYHLLAHSQLTTQVVKKRFATEKVGNVVSLDGRVQIIEYSDLPDSVAQLQTADNQLKLWAGNIAVHVFDRSFLESVVASDQGLPFHRAHKAVSFIDPSGKQVIPQQPNAIKFERFVFDLLPLAERALVVEGKAAQIFAPVKNANGAAVDTPDTAQAALLALHRQWLQQAGADVPNHIRVEINPLWGLDAVAVSQHPDITGLQFAADTYLQ